MRLRHFPLVLAVCCELAGLTSACRDRGPVTDTSYTLRGRIRFTDFGLPFPDNSFGGDVQLLIFDNADEGYCLKPGSITGVGFNVLRSPDLETLRTDGIAYELNIPEAPELVYPYGIHLMAVWQHTSALSHVCETDGVSASFNAAAYQGLTPSDFALGPTSACCGFSPRPLIVEARGAVFEDIDLLLVPQAFSPLACVAPESPTDVCAGRHPPGQTFGDSLCFQALGEDATNVFGGCP